MHGAERITQWLCQALKATPRVLVVVVGTSGGKLGRPGVRLVRRLGRLIIGLLRLVGARRSGGAVYITGAGGELLWYQFVVVVLARFMRLRTVFHHHSFAYLHTPRLSMRLLTEAGGPHLSHVVLCERMAADLRRRYPAVRTVRVCSNAGLMESAPDAGSEKRGSLVLGHLSSLSREKGVIEVFDTLRLVRSRGYDAQLLLAGPCTTPEVEKAVAAAVLEFGDALTVLGRVDSDEVADFYRQIDLFLFPSRYVQEAEPLVVLDASRNGVASVAFAVGCLPGMVELEHAVPVDGNFPEVVAGIVENGAIQPAGAIAQKFMVRRRSAIDAHHDLVTHLIGS